MTSNSIRVDRSPVRQLLLGIAGLFLVISAIDIVWVHVVSRPPETTAEGTLTPRGEKQASAHIIWGSSMLVVGGGLLAIALGGLIIRRPVVELDEEGLRLRLSRPTADLSLVPWSEVLAVRSGSDTEAPGGRPLPVLLVDVADPSRLPRHPWGAEWRDDTLEIDADGWNMPPEQVAVHAQLMLDQRHHGSS